MVKCQLKIFLRWMPEAKIYLFKKGGIMPWYNGDYPPSYKNQPKHLRDKAVEIANEILKESGDEGIAIATGLKKAREYFEEHPQEKDK
ncbi:hypothetical protein [Pedobacter nutrimenti]|uniref:hypothetical protein n=1 Tax=Pedobacter nutrimenti TaxID=1241337 RepID=UPI00292F26E2|nr:hypothetical protein [Pedobacter nutrimenti]